MGDFSPRSALLRPLLIDAFLASLFAQQTKVGREEDGMGRLGSKKFRGRVWGKTGGVSLLSIVAGHSLAEHQLYPGEVQHTWNIPLSSEYTQTDEIFQNLNFVFKRRSNRDYLDSWTYSKPLSKCQDHLTRSTRRT